MLRSVRDGAAAHGTEMVAGGAMSGKTREVEIFSTLTID
jgi:hypothetical protein